MPFYSRHSDDISDNYYLSTLDDGEYNSFMRMIYTNSRFGADIQSHYDSSDADVIPTSSEEERPQKTKEQAYQSKHFQEKQNRPDTFNICGKTLSNSSNIKKTREI
ncbi:MAG: hypothetical protein NXI08_16785 [bacterium]|nr:hypothetical protein [bacterium]